MTQHTEEWREELRYLWEKTMPCTEFCKEEQEKGTTDIGCPRHGIDMVKFLPKAERFISDLLQKTKEEERNRILSLPCMEDEKEVEHLTDESKYDEKAEARNSLRNQIREEIEV